MPGSIYLGSVSIGRNHSEVLRRQGVAFSSSYHITISNVALCDLLLIVDTRYILSTHMRFLLNSVFGEDALVNVSVEKKDDNDGKLAGYIRIRSKTQGIALSLGDRITSVQRGFPEKQ